MDDWETASVTGRRERDGRLVRLAPRHGSQSTLSYDGSGRLASIGDPAGRGALTLGYDPTSGRLTSVTDWATPARVVRYGYDTSGRLSTVTNRENQITTFGYDGTSHRLTTVTDARNNVLRTNAYDAQGRVDTQKDAKGLATGQLTRFTYGTNGATVTYPPASFDGAFSPTLQDTYDANGHPVRLRRQRQASADDLGRHHLDLQARREPAAADSAGGRPAAVRLGHGTGLGLRRRTPNIRCKRSRTPVE